MHPTERSATTPARRWLADAVAGVSVALVLIPQSMAYAELAGLPPHHGLYAGALPPLLAAFFASSPYLQTGPVATTSLLTFGALSTMAVPGTAEYVALAGLLALVVGVVRVALGVMKAGSVSYLMSEPLLRGFIAAAALLILLSQLPSALGATIDGGTVVGRAWSAITSPDTWEPAALGLSALTLVLMLGGPRLHALFPGVLVAVVAGVAVSVLVDYEGPVVGPIPAVFLPPLSVSLPWGSLPALVVSGIIIALVGFAEAASISQTLADEQRDAWDPNREFVSQGVANIAAGLTAGLPVGGSFGRSAVGHLAGAQTRWSGAITGLVVLAFLPFAGVLHALPKAVLGGIVIGAVLGLVAPRPLVSMWAQSRLQALVAYCTFVLTLALAPRVDYAVIAGVGIALAVHVWREQHVQVEVEERDGVLRLRPQGVIWFGSAPLFRRELARELAARPEVGRALLDLSAVGRIDLTGALVLRDVVEHARQSGLDVRVGDAAPHAHRILARVGLSLGDD